MNNSHGYKESQIGKIPNHWNVAKINEFAYTKSGGTPSTFVPEYWENGNIPWLLSGSLKNNYLSAPDKYITQYGLDNSSAILFPKNSVLIALTGATTGKVGYLKFDSTGNQSITAIYPNKKFISKYLFYYLQKAYDRIFSMAVGAAQPHINKQIVDSIEIAIPPLPEQHKIAEILSIVDDAIEKTDAIIKETQQLKKGLMQKLFTEGIRHTKFKETKIGRIPEEWKLVKVGEICDFIVPGRNKPTKFDGDIPWINIPDILNQPYVNKSLNKKNISIDEAKRCGNRIVPNGAVIMSCVGNFGIITIAKRDLFINQQLHAFVTPSLLNKEFLRFVLILSKPYMERIATYTTVPYMNKKNCNSIPIPLPSLNEQNKIVKMLKSIELKIENEQETKKELVNLKKGLMQVLLTGKVRVKV